MISRIFQVEVVISRSRRLRLITPTDTVIILDITKTESNNCFIIHWMKQKKKTHFCASSLMASKTMRANLTRLPLKTMHRGHTRHDYMWPWHDYLWPWHDYCKSAVMTSQALISKIPRRFWPIRKEIVSSMYNNEKYVYYDNDFFSPISDSELPPIIYKFKS